MQKEQTFNSLVPGDRFYFSSDTLRVVYQLIQKGLYNRVNPNGEKQWPYDRQAFEYRAVVLLRNVNDKTNQRI